MVSRNGLRKMRSFPVSMYPPEFRMERPRSDDSHYPYSTANRIPLEYESDALPPEQASSTGHLALNVKIIHVTGQR